MTARVNTVENRRARFVSPVPEHMAGPFAAGPPPAATAFDALPQSDTRTFPAVEWPASLERRTTMTTRPFALDPRQSPMLAPVASGRGSAIGRLARHVHRWFRARRDYHHVSELPDYLLADIGVSRHQLEAASARTKILAGPGLLIDRDGT